MVITYMNPHSDMVDEVTFFAGMLDPELYVAGLKHANAMSDW